MKWTPGNVKDFSKWLVIVFNSAERLFGKNIADTKKKGIKISFLSCSFCKQNFFFWVAVISNA